MSIFPLPKVDRPVLGSATTVEDDPQEKFHRSYSIAAAAAHQHI
jgi:hypothetical protein